MKKWLTHFYHFALLWSIWMNSASLDLLRARHNCPVKIMLPLYHWKIFLIWKVYKTPWSTQIWKTGHSLPWQNRHVILYLPNLESLPWHLGAISVLEAQISTHSDTADWFVCLLLSILTVHSISFMKQRCLSETVPDQESREVNKYISFPVPPLHSCKHIASGLEDITLHTYTVQHKSTCDIVSYIYRMSRRTARYLDLQIVYCPLF